MISSVDWNRIAALLEELEDAHDEARVWHDPHDAPGLTDPRYDAAEARFAEALRQLRELTAAGTSDSRR